MKKKLALILTILLLFTLASCKNDKNGSVDFGKYDIPSEAVITTSPTPYDISKLLNIDTSWQSEYALSYTFYDKNKGYSEIAEGKCGNYYQSMDYASNIITFISQEDGYMMEYVLNSEERTGTAAIITDSNIDNINSGFTMLSACDPYLPVYINVTEVGSDFIANRSATRYKQVQNENGVDKMIAYIWIDDQYSFASKCELYDAETQELILRWELQEFTQNVTEDGVKVNIDNYTITTD